MSKNESITCFINMIIMCIIIGMPLFFTGCNFSLTNFCPRYTSYTGIVYYIGRNDPGYNINYNQTNYNQTNYNQINYNQTKSYYLRRLAPLPKPTPGRPPSYDKDDEDDKMLQPIQYYYAINVLTYKKCHIKLDINNYYHKVPKIGDNVEWYKFKPIGMYEGRDEFCENKYSVEERWMGGLVLLVIGSVFILLLLCCGCCSPKNDTVISY